MNINKQNKHNIVDVWLMYVEKTNTKIIMDEPKRIRITVLK